MRRTRGWRGDAQARLTAGGGLVAVDSNARRGASASADADANANNGGLLGAMVLGASVCEVERSPRVDR